MTYFVVVDSYRNQARMPTQEMEKCSNCKRQLNSRVLEQDLATTMIRYRETHTMWVRERGLLLMAPSPRYIGRQPMPNNMVCHTKTKRGRGQIDYRMCTRGDAEQHRKSQGEEKN